MDQAKVSEMEMRIREKNYYDRFAQAFAYPLKSNLLLGDFIANPAVTGAYAEAWVRSMITAMLPQFRVSTGAVISHEDQEVGLGTTPQCDVIIWDPSYFPALFECGEFALVPKQSARAIIEIKRRCNNITKMKEQLKDIQDCLQPEYSPNVLGVVLAHRTPLFIGNGGEHWLRVKKYRNAPAVTRLLNKGEVDRKGVFVFTYFLSQIAGH
jgi:hypothetical protein